MSTPFPPVYSDGRELQNLRQALCAFETRLNGTRQALLTHLRESRRLDREWEEMVQEHDARQSRLTVDNSLASRIVEDINFDFALLGAALQRWIFRNDAGA